MRSNRRLAAVALLVTLAAAACTGDSPDPLATDLSTGPETALHPNDTFSQAARSAWSYVDREYQPATGFVNPVTGYSYATAWDLASGLAALYCGERLGLLDRAEYDRRMHLALQTLRTLPLFDGVAFNKNYSTTTGAVVGRDDHDTSVTERGYGWSALDVGRLLIWLKIISVNEPRFASEVNRVVNRISFSQLVRNGYLWGGELDASGNLQRYQEGRVGYEQYSASGFALWNHKADRASRLSENTLPITVLDVPLVADKRGGDFLTSEPYVLAGLEVGWASDMRDLATRVLRVQQERFRRTGQVTILSEDALPEPPAYFYYYTINLYGDQFVVSTPSFQVVGSVPRWISAKAAFGWHALLPSDYTRQAVDAVAAARGGDGWSSGVFEGSGASTGGANLNTAAVILESAVFSATGRPLVQAK